MRSPEPDGAKATHLYTAHVQSRLADVMDFAFFGSPTVVVVFVVCSIVAVLGIAGSMLRAIAARDAAERERVEANQQAAVAAPEPSAEGGINVPVARSHAPRLALATTIARGAGSGSQPQPVPAAPTAGTQLAGLAEVPDAGQVHTAPQEVVSPLAQNPELVVPHASVTEVAPIVAGVTPQPIVAPNTQPSTSMTAASSTASEGALQSQMSRGPAARPTCLDEELPDPSPHPTSSTPVVTNTADAPTRVLHLGTGAPAQQHAPPVATPAATHVDTGSVAAAQNTLADNTVTQNNVAQKTAGQDIAGQDSVAPTVAETDDMPTVVLARTPLQRPQAASLAAQASHADDSPAVAPEVVGEVLTTTGSIPVIAVASTSNNHAAGTIPATVDAGPEPQYLGGEANVPSQAAELDLRDGAPDYLVQHHIAGAEQIPPQPETPAQLETPAQAAASDVPGGNQPVRLRTQLHISDRSTGATDNTTQHSDFPENTDVLAVADVPASRHTTVGESTQPTVSETYQRTPAGPLEFRPDCPLTMVLPDQVHAQAARPSAIPESRGAVDSVTENEQELVVTDELSASRAALRRRRIAHLEAGVPDDAAWSRAPLQRDFEF